MKARYAAWFRVALAQSRVVRAPVVLRSVMPRGSVSRLLNPAWCERSLCWRGSGQRGSAERSCSCRIHACGPCLNSAIYQSSRPTSACSGRRFASSKIVRFSAPVSATMSLPSIGGGAAKAQPVGPSVDAVLLLCALVYTLPHYPPFKLEDNPE